MNEFKRFYVWGMNAKLYMGLYFSAIVFFLGAIKLFFGVMDIALFTLLQIMIVSLIIGFFQASYLNNMDYSKSIFSLRSIVWLIASSLLTLACCYGFNWLEGLPAWSNILVGILMPIGFIAMLIGEKFFQEQDTIRLNEDLKKFQDHQ